MNSVWVRRILYRETDYLVVANTGCTLGDANVMTLPFEGARNE
ncbi:MAG: hypothetical protein OSB26_00165 [Woeseiaceae bacterium]|nr:hypothetical protein [Woeseiaceae bacterium]